MKASLKYVVLFVLLIAQFSPLFSQQELDVETHPATDVYEGWQLSMQLWTFHKYTFMEALDKTASLGISWVEAFPGQKFSDEFPEAKFHHTMSVENRKMAKARLKSLGLKLVNYGVVNLPNDEKECRSVFDFAKEMGIKTIVSEPPEEAFDLIDRLCQEYKINVAIHNHPEPTHYWNPDRVVEMSKGRSKYIGACADIGHWMRSGIKPVDALKKLKGRVISFHFGDLNSFGDKEAHDVIWGSGIGELETVLTEMHRQGFKGVFSVEFEYNWEASVPDIRKSVAFFNKFVAGLKDAQWRSLMDDLTGWTFKEKSWVVADGVLSANGGGDIWTKERFGDFVLNLDFKLEDETNSGVFVRTGSIEKWLHSAIEVQILDSHGKEKINKHDCGAIFDCLEPSKNMVNKPGEWNRYTITCKANKINVVLNGQQIIDMDLDLWSEAHKNPDGTPNKFNTAYKEMSREGHIGLQYHGHPIYYRNIKIKEL
ncbi:MAG: DUF1080 domain-containing protein [Calditrichaeota bacterium]|nr:MAG: DUF1080 domain-containing protein [Calditrichota bacterium]MBL1205205.1 DUF1080 domain-containing protein [Calditrichota bacterium]NOG45035.1 DUF1080 domain-containing protein [Calditrichota bacterium]